MEQNIIEYARELSVNQLFNAGGFNTSWNSWRNEISQKLNPNITQQKIFNLGDHLRDIFRTTGQAGRSQSDVAGGGASWESLVCWYLNLCTVNRRTFVIKHNKKLIPEPINKAITVNYGNFRSNTESDLIAITFPDKPEYSMDKFNIAISDSNNTLIPITTSRNGAFNFLPILNTLVERDFNEIEIHIIQCKTNWNDNAQIPTLWDAIYSANTFRNGISVGSDGYSIHDIERFTYSFVTVPSNQLIKNGNQMYKINSTSVLRVTNLSGGNYWGLPSQQGIASSVKELVERNLKSGSSDSLLTTISQSLPYLSTTFSYFNL